MTDAEEHPLSKPTREIVALFVFSIGVLSVELSYTKLFSVMFWYHFGFLIVSTAMLGFAAAGVLLALLGERARKLSLFGLINLSAAGVVATYIAVLRLDTPSVSMVPSADTAMVMVAVAVLLFIPFLLLGLTVSWMLSERAHLVGYVYGANLIGSALGAGCFIVLFDNFAGEINVFINALLLLAAAALLIDTYRRLATWIPLCGVAVLLLLIAPDEFPIEASKSKPLGRVRKDSVISTEWNSLSRIDIFENPDHAGLGVGLWGIDPIFLESKRLPERLGVVIDASAYTTILRLPTDPNFFDYMPTTFAYNIENYYPKSLHIGAGGGMDLIAAHYHAVADIDGVEINPLIVNAVKGPLNEYAGGIYTGGIEGLEIHVSEGRNFIERTDEKYDLIQLSGVDTQTSTQAGAFALSENYLYTVEAFVSYLERLYPAGVLTLTRWHLPDREGRKTYSLRMVCLVREALERMGLDPKDRVFYFRDDGPNTVLTVQLEPFREDQIAAGINFIERRGFVPMVVPGRALGTIYEEFLYADSDDYRKRVADYPYDVSGPTDDRPFIFELQRLGMAFRNDSWPTKEGTTTGLEILLVLLAELAILGLVFLWAPSRALARRRNLTLAPSLAAFFALIGYAYISLEIALSQKLVLYLGHPTYALSVAIAGMLFFSGLGSFTSERLGDVGRRRALLALVPILLVTGVSLGPLLGASLGASFAVRLSVTLLLLAPVAFLMGFPFPWGVRRIEANSVPLAWAVNGFFSVVGSVLAVVIGISWGFKFVLIAASLAYVNAIAIAALQPSERSAQSS